MLLSAVYDFYLGKISPYLVDKHFSDGLKPPDVCHWFLWFVAWFLVCIWDKQCPWNNGANEFQLVEGWVFLPVWSFGGFLVMVFVFFLICGLSWKKCILTWEVLSCFSNFTKRYQFWFSFMIFISGTFMANSVKHIRYVFIICSAIIHYWDVHST